MAVSKAQQASVNKYVKSNYDRINVTMPKGRKAEIKGCADSMGESVNAYINAAIDDRMAKEADGPVCTVPVSPGTFYAATEAAEASGESLAEFVSRAIIETIDRDRQGTPTPGDIGESG